jgi:hypothetical protein
MKASFVRWFRVAAFISLACLTMGDTVLAQRGKGGSSRGGASRGGSSRGGSRPSMGRSSSGPSRNSRRRVHRWAASRLVDPQYRHLVGLHNRQVVGRPWAVCRGPRGHLAASRVDRRRPARPHRARPLAQVRVLQWRVGPRHVRPQRVHLLVHPRRVRAPGLQLRVGPRRGPAAQADRALGHLAPV